MISFDCGFPSFTALGRKLITVNLHFPFFRTPPNKKFLLWRFTCMELRIPTYCQAEHGSPFFAYLGMKKHTPIFQIFHSNASTPFGLNVKYPKMFFLAPRPKMEKSKPSNWVVFERILPKEANRFRFAKTISGRRESLPLTQGNSYAHYQYKTQRLRRSSVIRSTQSTSTWIFSSPSSYSR